MRLVGVTLVTLGATLVVLLQPGCTLLTGADRLGTCDSCEIAMTHDTTLPTPTAKADGGGGGGTNNTTPSSPTENMDASAGTPSASGLPKNPQACDGYTCSGATPFCCELENARGGCTATAAECLAKPESAVVACSGAADCDSGQVCCANATLRTARCVATNECPVAPEQRVLCEDSDECKDEELCIGSSSMFDRDFCEPF